MTTSAPRTWWLALFLLSVALVGAFHTSEMWLTGDGPHHLLGAYVHAHPEAGGFQRWLTPHTPPSSRAYLFLFVALEPWLGWREANAVIVVLAAASFAWGFAFFVTALAPQRRWLGLLGFALAPQWALYAGFLPFLLSLGGGLLGGALALRLGPGLPGGVVLALVSYVVARGHLIAAVLVGAAVAIVWIVRAPSPRTALWLLPSAVLGGLVASSLLGGEAYTDGGLDLSTVPETLERLGPYFQAGPWWRSLLVWAALGVLLWRLVRARAASADERPLLMAGLVFLVLAFVVPWTAQGWQFAQARVFPFVVLFGVALLPGELRPRLMIVCVLLIDVVNLSWARLFHEELAARAKPALAALDVPLTDPGYRLPIVLEPYAGYASAEELGLLNVPPLGALGPVYAVAQGGMVPWVFASSVELHTVLFRPGLQLPFAPSRGWWLQALKSDDAGERAGIVRMLMRAGSDFDGVILYGRAPDAAAFEAAGYRAQARAEAEDTTLLLAKFIGCAAVIQVSAARLGPGARPPSVDVALGWAGVPDAWRTLTVALPPLADELSEVSWPNAPCDGAWMSVGGGMTCHGADAQGRLWLTADGPTLCEVSGGPTPR